MLYNSNGFLCNLHKWKLQKEGLICIIAICSVNALGAYIPSFVYQIYLWYDIDMNYVKACHKSTITWRKLYSCLLKH
uniref:Uncharacterized protein n=1 Tax=Arundo donax TaxID=35708 RepID=A0A0A9AAP7_ARUDO